jgi:archaellum component FlaC
MEKKIEEYLTRMASAIKELKDRVELIEAKSNTLGLDYDKAAEQYTAGLHKGIELMYNLKQEVKPDGKDNEVRN